MKVGFVGFGGVGQAMASVFAAKGREILVKDISQNARDIATSMGFKTTEDFNDFETCDVVYVTVPTFGGDFPRYDTTIVTNILTCLKDYKKPILLTSTMLPGNTKKLADSLEMQNLVFSPQFMRDATAADDFERCLPLPYLIFGFYDVATVEKWGSVIVSLMEGLPGYIGLCDYDVAEHIKTLHSLNLMVRVAVNNAYLSAIEPDKRQSYATLLSSDPRIGLYGSDIKGKFGGTCLPNYLDGLMKHEGSKYLNSLLFFLVEEQRGLGYDNV